MASIMYNIAKAGLANGTLVWGTGSWKVMLVGSSYTANPDDNYVSAVAGAELSGTNYTGGYGGSGRKLLSSMTVVQDNTNDKAQLKASDVTWTQINAGTVAAAVLFKEGASDAASTLCAYIDISDVVTNGGDFTIQWNAQGILNLS